MTSLLPRSGPEADVSGWSSVGVDAVWWYDRGEAVRCHDNGPFAVVGQTVVEGAQQASIVEVGDASVGPAVEVVRFAPGGWPVAAWPDAAFVADGEGQALVAVEQALAAAKV